jgi:UDP-2,4-diacetamido-2,4,6-trideoxy-beta-L-altropyranose hydrolase
MNTVVFRADGSANIGLGHIMRCLTLAGSLKARGAEAVFVTKGYSESVPSIIRRGGFECFLIPPGCTSLEDLDFLLKAADEKASRIAVCDGYFMDEAYFAAIKSAGFKLLVIDDLADRCLPADLVLNQNVYAAPEMYEGLTDAKLLLGTDFAIIRREFAEARPMRKPAGIVREVLVTLGGSDPANQTLKVLRALCGMDGDFRVTAVLGAANGHIERIRAFASKSGRDIEIIVNAGNMAELMVRADMGITAGGTTTWETCCVGLPTIVVSLADNQEMVLKTLAEHGIANVLGRAEWLSEEDIASVARNFMSDPDERQELSTRGMALVDGFGAGRAAEMLMELAV